jgi:hypothetical protein
MPKKRLLSPRQELAVLLATLVPCAAIAGSFGLAWLVTWFFKLSPVIILPLGFASAYGCMWIDHARKNRSGRRAQTWQPLADFLAGADAIVAPNFDGQTDLRAWLREVGQQTHTLAMFAHIEPDEPHLADGLLIVRRRRSPRLAVSHLGAEISRISARDLAVDLPGVDRRQAVFFIVAWD